MYSARAGICISRDNYTEDNVLWNFIFCLVFLLFRLAGKEWLVPSRPLVNPPEERRLGSSWPPKLPGKARPPPVEWRSPTDTGIQASQWSGFDGSAARLLWRLYMQVSFLGVVIPVQHFYSHVFWWFDRPWNTVVHSIKVTPDLFFCQAWYCCSAWDPSVPEVHWAAHQEAAFPAPCQGNRPGFQDRSAFPECSYWRSTGIELNFIYIFYILLFKCFFFSLVPTLIFLLAV